MFLPISTTSYQWYSFITFCNTLLIVFIGECSISGVSKKATSVGCDVVDGVSKKVTLLIKGIQDKSRLAGKELSNKEIKAQELISKGHNIRILSENDFLELVNET